VLIEIDTSSRQLDWTVKGTDRVAQNVYNLITTLMYEVAFDRTLGIKGDFIDKPLQIAIAEVTAEIYDAISEREPRAIVKSVEFSEIDNDGNMQFKVVIEV
jgi:phage baseplate assembly protein W